MKSISRRKECSVTSNEADSVGKIRTESLSLAVPMCGGHRRP